MTAPSGPRRAERSREPTDEARPPAKATSRPAEGPRPGRGSPASPGISVRGPGGADETAAVAWQALRELVMERHDRRAEVAAAVGLSYIRVKALRQLARRPLTLRELAETLSTDAPYTSVVVDDLAERGLLERRPDPADRRRKIATLTAAGRRAARKADRIMDAPPAALRNLPPDDLAALRRILASLLAEDP